MKKAALYIRVSTTTQADEGLSIPAQLKLLKEYAIKNSYTFSEEHIYIDAGESARTADRPEFQRMIANAKQKPKPFDAVLVHKTDRFARNRLDSSVYKSLLRKECGIDVISITEEFGDDPYGVMLEGIMELFAEFYSLNLSAEVKKGMNQAAEQGLALGLPPFGYDINPETKKYSICEPEAEVVRDVFSMYIKSGLGTDAIYTYLLSTIAYNKYGDVIRYRESKSLKDINRIGKKYEVLWAGKTISRMLKNVTYIGTYRWKDVVIENNHPAIICKEVFNEAQELMTSRRSRRTDVSNDHMLRFLAKCAYCGKAMYRHVKRTPKKTYNYLRCSNKNNNLICTNKTIAMAGVEAAIIKELESIIEGSVKDIKLISKGKVKQEKNVEKIKGLLSNFDKQFDRQMQAYQAEVITLEQLTSYKAKLEKEKQALENELKQAETAANDYEADSEALKKRIADVIGLLKSDELNGYEKNRIASSILEKVVINIFKNNIELYYKID